MAISNKIHLYVRESMNKWYQFRKGKYSVQLNGDERKGWPWLEQYAKRLGKDDFMADFTEILEAIEKDNQVLRERWEYQIAIFSLYISE